MTSLRMGLHLAMDYKFSPDSRPPCFNILNALSFCDSRGLVASRSMFAVQHLISGEVETDTKHV